MAAKEVPFSYEPNAFAVVQLVADKGERPEPPSKCPKRIVALMKQAWKEKPGERPTFQAIVAYLRNPDEAGAIQALKGTDNKQPACGCTIA